MNLERRVGKNEGEVKACRAEEGSQIEEHNSSRRFALPETIACRAQVSIALLLRVYIYECGCD